MSALSTPFLSAFQAPLVLPFIKNLQDTHTHVSEDGKAEPSVALIPTLRTEVTKLQNKVRDLKDDLEKERGEREQALQHVAQSYAACTSLRQKLVNNHSILRTTAKSLQ